MNQLKTTFLKETTKFAVACLNGRKNGTIYFGVHDGKNKEEHGQIDGIPIAYEDRKNFAEWMDEAFYSEAPSQFHFDEPDYSMLAAIRYDLGLRFRLSFCEPKIFRAASVG